MYLIGMSLCFIRGKDFSNGSRRRNRDRLGEKLFEELYER